MSPFSESSRVVHNRIHQKTRIHAGHIGGGRRGVGSCMSVRART